MAWRKRPVDFNEDPAKQKKPKGSSSDEQKIHTKGKTTYKISFKVFDKKNHGTNADLSITFHGAKTKSLPIPISDGLVQNFKRDDVISFSVTSHPMKDIEMIEFSRVSHTGYLSQWFVEEVRVERPDINASWIFPVLQWIETNETYMASEKGCHTSLPQNDSRQKERHLALEDGRKLYEFGLFFPGGPVKVKSIPLGEVFSLTYDSYLGIRGAEDEFCALSLELFEKPWKSLDGIQKVLYKHVHESGIYPQPKSVEILQSTAVADEYFGQLRLTGANPYVIKLCTFIPERLRNEEGALKDILDGNSFEVAMAKKKLFVVDLDILQGIETKDGFVICAPIAWFYLNEKQILCPIAIQLKQDTADENPLFLPTDPVYTWMMAKLWFNNADAAYHESVAHLVHSSQETCNLLIPILRNIFIYGFTHLLMEGFAVNTHRNLAPAHPLFKLLMPHFLFLIQINALGVELLLGKGDWVDTVMNTGRKGMKGLIRRKLKTWRLDTDGTLPEELKRRGVYDKELLPRYYFRDDALELYNIIVRYVASYIDLYYKTADDFRNDYELQNWARTIVARRPEGQGIMGVPGNGIIDNPKDLCAILTSIIYTCSVAHASVNFMQYDQYGFPPAYPAYLKGVPPTNKDPLTEQNVLDALPGMKITIEIMKITRLLSGMGTHKLGDFEINYISDPNAKEVLNRFREELNTLSEDLDKKTRDPPYPWLNPKNVPNAISI